MAIGVKRGWVPKRRSGVLTEQRKMNATTMMTLLRFRVKNFRSVEDSGWIEVSSIASLIGTNESGKTNLLLPLWKLNPAQDGEIQPLVDFPRKRYIDFRSMDQKPVFIEAEFRLPDELIKQIATLTGAPEEEVTIAKVQRDFDGKYQVGFPEAVPQRHVSKEEVVALLKKTQDDIAKVPPTSQRDEELKRGVLEVLTRALDQIKSADEELNEQVLEAIQKILQEIDLEKAVKRSTIAPRFGQVVDDITDMVESITKLHPEDIPQARQLIIKNLPKFVYYSNYGNLDSEIYLPHVIENIQRTDLGSREEAKVRTLKVLFEFVKLDPEEILELGKETPIAHGRPTEQQIQETSERKKERDVLLQSAGTKLTEKFRAWWKQGEYRFKFQADGNHFRIWVSDDKRPEEIELENRSTGLQWFLSFYLIFLVESADSHAGAILLLDEPGMTLHPIAQRDLSNFFTNLSETNQLIYTTHSPFLVDPDHLDRVKAVYVGDEGTTQISSNLRAGEKNPAQTRSIYPVHAALGLSVSDTLLQGCQPIIVEGPSDQHYLSAIKNYLIGKGLITPKREMVFVPSGGVKGVSPIVALLAGAGGALPYVLLDSDASGQGMIKQLSSNLYSGAADRVIQVGDWRNIQNAEIEDLFPAELLAKILNRFYPRDLDEEFTEVVMNDQPIVPQAQKFAIESEVTLPRGWKVDVAQQVKTQLLKDKDPMKKHDLFVEAWTKLFERLQD